VVVKLLPQGGAMTVSRVLQLLRDDPLLADMDRVSDAQLLQSFLATRADAAFAGLVRRHSGMVWGVCLRILRQHQDAEDAFQATFLVLLRKAASIRPAGMVGNWLYGVAHHIALKARSMSDKRRSRERQQEAPLANAAAKPEASQELPHLLDQELSRLPDKYRAIIVLCELEGKTRAEAARQLGIPEGTAAGRLTRGRSLLARRLARQGLALSATALSSTLAQSTLAAAPATVVASVLHSSRLTAPAAVSARVSALTEGMVKMMFVQQLLRRLGSGLLLVALILGGALLWQYALAQSPGDQAGSAKPPVTVTEEQPPPRKKSKTPDAQKKPNMPADDLHLWSQPVGGLQGRLRVERRDVINGTPLFNVLLELRNVSEPRQVIRVTLSRPLNEKVAYFHVTDAAGNAVKMYNGPYDGTSRDPETLKIAAGDTLVYDISGRGVGIPANEAALLDLGSSANWSFKAGDPTAYFLHAKLDLAGIGTLELPKVQLPTSPEIGYLEVDMRGRLVHMGRDFRVVVRGPDNLGGKALSLIFRSNADKGFQSGQLLAHKDKQVHARGTVVWLPKEYQANLEKDWDLGVVFRDPEQLLPAEGTVAEEISVKAKGVLSWKDMSYRVTVRLQDRLGREVTLDLVVGEDKFLVRKLEALKGKAVIVSGPLTWAPKTGQGQAASDEINLELRQFEIKLADADAQKKDESPLDNLPQDRQKEEDSPLGGLPDQDRLQWDLKALEARFKIISTSMPPSESKEVCLLLEAKADGLVHWSEFTTSLFDKDKVRIDILAAYDTPGSNTPAVRIEGGIPQQGQQQIQAAAGERLRVYLRLPSKATWQNVRNVKVGTNDAPR
jgi:RNA polymerase sigma factor (sigma-70 family)